MKKSTHEIPLWAINTKRIMKENGMTQDDLAKPLGVTRGAVGLYLRGEREIKESTIRKIAEALDVTLNDLYADTDGPNGEKPKGHDSKRLTKMQREAIKAIESLPDADLKPYRDLLIKQASTPPQ